MMNAGGKVRNFYGLSEATRVAMTLLAMKERRTLIERWLSLNTVEGQGWDARTKQAAALLARERSVVDFGCGNMSLESYLPPETVYVPVDVVRRDARTLVIDLNIEPPPRLEVDVCTCLGLLEYLFDVPGFLMQLSHGYTVAVVSYNPADLGDQHLDRRSHAWVNDYHRAGLESIFMRTGWDIEISALEGQSQVLWRLRSNVNQRRGKARTPERQRLQSPQQPQCSILPVTSR
jgi:hypothetical protein